MGQHTHPGLWGRAVRVEVVPNGPLFTSRSPLRTWVGGSMVLPEKNTYSCFSVGAASTHLVERVMNYHAIHSDLEAFGSWI